MNVLFNNKNNQNFPNVLTVFKGEKSIFQGPKKLGFNCITAIKSLGEFEEINSNYPCDSSLVKLGKIALSTLICCYEL